MSNQYQDLNIPHAPSPENSQPQLYGESLSGPELQLTPQQILAIGDDLYHARIEVAALSAEIQKQLDEHAKPSLALSPLRSFIPGFENRGNN